MPTSKNADIDIAAINFPFCLHSLSLVSLSSWMPSKKDALTQCRTKPPLISRHPCRLLTWIYINFMLRELYLARMTSNITAAIIINPKNVCK